MATEVPQHVIATRMWQVPSYLLFHDADVQFQNRSTRVYPVHTKAIHSAAEVKYSASTDLLDNTKPSMIRDRGREIELGFISQRRDASRYSRLPLRNEGGANSAFPTTTNTQWQGEHRAGAQKCCNAPHGNHHYKQAPPERKQDCQWNNASIAETGGALRRSSETTLTAENKGSHRWCQ